jgi:hypothetical protein
MLLLCRFDHSSIVTSFSQLPCYLFLLTLNGSGHGGSSRVVVATS